MYARLEYKINHDVRNSNMDTNKLGLLDTLTMLYKVMLNVGWDACDIYQYLTSRAAGHAKGHIAMHKLVCSCLHRKHR